MNDQSQRETKTPNPAVTIHEPALGEIVDGFYLEELLSERSANNLFRVTHPEYNLPMIMKVPRLGITVPASTFTEFEVEMRILSRLHGVYTPRVIAKGDLATCPYMVMEYIEGDDLMQAINQAPVSVDQLANIMIPICKAVHELHRHNIIHLDIKPNNIRTRTDGSAVILDFGTAHHAHLPDPYDDPHKKAPRSFDYVAPEQLHNIRTDSRSDVYALGVILYQLATGKLPFGKKANHITVNKRLYLPPMPPRAHDEAIPAWLQEVILRCLERRPENRFLSAKQIANLLTHPSMVSKSKRSELTKKPGYITIARSWLHSRSDDYHQGDQLHPRERIANVPHILVALDLDNTSEELQQSLRNSILQLIKMDRMSVFTVMTVVEKNDLRELEGFSEVAGKEYPTHVQRQMELRHWLMPLKLPYSRLHIQVTEGNAAHEIIAYCKYHVIDKLVIGARGNSSLRQFMGSVSTKVVAEAPCSVIVVRTRRDTQAPTKE